MHLRQARRTSPSTAQTVSLGCTNTLPRSRPPCLHSLATLAHSRLPPSEHNNVINRPDTSRIRKQYVTAPSGHCWGYFAPPPPWGFVKAPRLLRARARCTQDDGYDDATYPAPKEVFLLLSSILHGFVVSLSKKARRRRQHDVHVSTHTHGRATQSSHKRRALKAHIKGARIGQVSEYAYRVRYRDELLRPMTLAATHAGTPPKRHRCTTARGLDRCAFALASLL